MNRAARLLYGAAGQLSRVAPLLAPPDGSRASIALRARRGLTERYADWARRARDRSRPLVWVHAASVGEGLQAKPVLSLLRAERPDVQIVYTFFSPSGRQLAGKMDADYEDFLPFDNARDMDAALDALRPTLLAFSKLDVWPVLVERAKLRGVPVALISATLPAHSRRLTGLGAGFTRDAYLALDAIGAASPSDADSFAAAGIPRARIDVTGDTSFDQVLARARAARPSLVERLASSRFTLVAGSTWPSDHRVLFPAWERIRARDPHARLVIAPHDLSDRHLGEITAWAGASRSVARLGEPGAERADVVVIDRYGVLGDVYAVADVAYVGGGLHAAGLHSVIEPAAYGVPVIYGSRHARRRDADLLVAAGGAAAIDSAASLERAITAWLAGPERKIAGARALAVVNAESGASRRTYALLMALMSGPFGAA
ncbi:MAG TPA: glycosyltransferase N-terminal domain-containing protein [Gemmatimonadaceae bacterium]|nr:glycosyltransferase N-terminal domain-containing protein [Gemmatimonadaceae bacterium]